MRSPRSGRLDSEPEIWVARFRAQDRGCFFSALCVAFLSLIRESMQTRDTWRLSAVHSMRLDARAVYGARALRGTASTFHIVLSSTVLYCSVLYSTVFYCTVPCCTVQCVTGLFCIAGRCVGVPCLWRRTFTCARVEWFGFLGFYTATQLATLDLCLVRRISRLYQIGSGDRIRSGQIIL